MPHVMICGASLIALLLGGPPAHAQKATEQLIPLGQSPGLSSIRTDIAEIEAVNAELRSVTLGAAADRRTVRVTERTQIWLDLSTYGQSNVTGGFDDLKAGRQAEVKYENDQRRQSAEWIKVVPERVE